MALGCLQTPPGDSVTGGRVSSVDPRNVGITKAKACFVGDGYNAGVEKGLLG